MRLARSAAEGGAYFIGVSGEDRDEGKGPDEAGSPPWCARAARPAPTWPLDAAHDVWWSLMPQEKVTSRLTPREAKQISNPFEIFGIVRGHGTPHRQQARRFDRDWKTGA